MKKIKLLLCLIVGTIMVSACSNQTKVVATVETTTVSESTAETTTVSESSVETNTAPINSESEKLSILETKEYSSFDLLMSAASSNVLVDDVKNGTGTKTIGTRATIVFPKDEFKKITPEQYAEFVDTVIKDSGYNWFTLNLSDGTGITYPGCMGIASDYGKLDKDGIVFEVQGTIFLSDEGYVYEAFE